jgi:diguanylate cyclase (GGDEF)-like protein
MSLINTIANIGSEQQSFSSANRTKMLNFISIFSAVVSSLYTLNYVFILNQPLVASINSIFTFAYLGSLFFNYRYHRRFAKIWFFSILMLHLYLCTNLYVTKASGFHLYYFLVPTGAFLLFELSEKIEKISLSIIAAALFFYSENTINLTPLIELTDDLNHALYQSVVFIIMLEIIIVLTLFAKQIELNEQNLIKQASTDALTNLSNRRDYFTKGRDLVAQANVKKTPISVCLLDFDHFKQVNDRYGHFIGDLCLVEISKLVHTMCRSNDVFARIGGEEFALIFPHTTEKQAIELTNMMRIAIEQHNIDIDDQASFSCSASFGVASTEASDGSFQQGELKSLLTLADKALYQAKAAGRNQVKSFTA